MLFVYLIHNHEVIVVAELVYGWEESLLLLYDWPGGFGVSVSEFVGKFILEHMSEDT